VDVIPKRIHRPLVLRLLAFTAGAFAFGFALVPLYSVFCDITGFGNRARLVEAAPQVEAPVGDRRVTIEFVSSVPTFGSWEFRPAATTMTVEPGRMYEAKFFAKNLRTQPVVAQAVPSIAPMQATRYFHKTECFCFAPQPFEAQQGRDLIVRFIVDPKLPATIDRVTLGYAMYESPAQAAAAPRVPQTRS
jgi:cytochrome c oxidase assembly protein subunit 11